MKFRDMFSPYEVEFGSVNKIYKEFIKLDTLYRKLVYVSGKIKMLEQRGVKTVDQRLNLIDYMDKLTAEYIVQYKKYNTKFINAQITTMCRMYDVKWEEKYKNLYNSCKEYLKK